jgi:hypothetical protein
MTDFPRSFPEFQRHFPNEVACVDYQGQRMKPSKS